MTPTNGGDAEASIASDSTSIDEGNIISLIRRLLPDSNTLESREQAGALLWDLSVIDAVSHVMVHAGMILSVLEAVVTAELQNVIAAEQQHQSENQSTDPARQVEVAFGILGNLAAHSELSELLVQQLTLLDMLTGWSLHTISSEPALSELCRLASTALRKPGGTEWLTRLCSQDVADRLIWIARQAHDPVLHARCLDLIVALLHTEQRGRDAAHLSTQPATPQEQTHTAQQTTNLITNSHGRPSHGSAVGQPADALTHSVQQNTTGIHPEQPDPNALQTEQQPLQPLTGIPHYPCASNLTEAGLLALISDVLQQASVPPSRQFTGVATGSTWADVTPLHPANMHNTPTVHRPRQAATPVLGQGNAVHGNVTPRLGNGNATAHGPLGSVAEEGQHGLPISEMSVDAALRATEVLGALPEHSPQLQQLLADHQLVRHVVQLLHTTSSEQVLESLLLAIQALSSTALQILADVSHISALLDCLGELPSGERGAWQREVVVWLTAKSLQQLVVLEGQDAVADASNSSSQLQTSPQSSQQEKQPSLGSPLSQAPLSSRLAVTTNMSSPPPTATVTTAATGTTKPQSPRHKEDHHQYNKDLLELGRRVCSLQDNCGVAGKHIDEYLRVAAQSMVVLITARHPDARTDKTATNVVNALRQVLIDIPTTK